MADGDTNQVTPPLTNPPASDWAAVALTDKSIYRGRRQMAWLAMWSMVLLTGYAVSPWMPIERYSKIADLLSWFYMAMTSVIAAYMGSTAAPLIFGRK